MTKELIQSYLGKEVSKRRKDIGVNQNELAIACGCSRTNMVNIEKGKHGVTITTLYAICCVLDCQPSDLFPAIKPMKREKIVLEKTVFVPKIIKVAKTKLG